MTTDPDGLSFFTDPEARPMAPESSVFGTTAYDRLDALFTAEGVDELGVAALPEPTASQVPSPAERAHLVDAAFTDEDLRLLTSPARTLLADRKRDFILNGPRLEPVAASRGRLIRGRR